MNQTEKKCLIGSATMHLFLMLLVVVGSAFFVPKAKQAVDLPSLKVVPQDLVDDALSGGGGNPKIAPSDAQQKGDTLTPQPAELRPTPPQPKPPTKPVEVRNQEPAPPVKQSSAKPKETVKPEANSKTAQNKPPLLKLTPTVRTSEDKAKAGEEAQAQQMAAATKKAASELKKARENLRTGFLGGTEVEVSGPGGKAYANYLQFVRAAYDDRWQVPHDVADDDAAALVSVTIRRDGQVLSARIVRASGNSILDKSVLRVLDSVKFIRPFPESSRERERTFTIEFSLKAKRLTG